MKQLSNATCALVLLSLGCGEQPASVELGSSLDRPYESVSEIATYARGAGYVFVGEPLEPPAPYPSLYAEATEDLQFEYPVASAAVSVEDALGEALGDEVVLVGRAGEARIVDQDGNVSDRFHVDSGGRWRYKSLPEEGRWVFFVIPVPEREALIWRAELLNGLVSGEGTTSGEDLPLDALRLP